MKHDLTQQAWSEPQPANTAFLVLCGGRGARMGGADKPLLAWHGKPMVDHILASVPADMRKLISANRNLARYASRGQVLEDAPVLQRHETAPGPLVGVMAGFDAIAQRPEQQWLLVCPGDTPRLPKDWWTVMQRTAAEHHADAVVAFDGERQQHLHLLLHQSLRDSLLGYLRAGHTAVFAWLHSVEAERACFFDPQAFRNFNQPRDLEERPAQ